MISLIEFLSSGDYPLDYAEDILFEPEIPIYKGKASIVRFDPTGDIFCNKTDATAANILALDLMRRDTCEIPKILAAIGAGTHTANDIMSAIPGQHLANYAIEQATNQLSIIETDSVFRQIHSPATPIVCTKLASRLAAVYYYQIRIHYDWIASPEFTDHLRTIITTRYKEIS